MNKQHLVWHDSQLTAGMRQSMNGHRAVILWFTGLSGSGKSTLAVAVDSALYRLGCRSFVLDGDNVRHGLCNDLGFSDQDRHENLRRIAEVAKLFTQAGMISICAFISPFAQDRQRIRSLVPAGDFIEIYCQCALETCELRDVKGLYAKARRGEIPQYTGIDSPYEAPEHPDLLLNTDHDSVEHCLQQIMDFLQTHQIISKRMTQV